jgi:hypothetical protein
MNQKVLIVGKPESDRKEIYIRLIGVVNGARDIVTIFESDLDT